MIRTIALAAGFVVVMLVAIGVIKNVGRGIIIAAALTAGGFLLPKEGNAVGWSEKPSG